MTATSIIHTEFSPSTQATQIVEPAALVADTAELRDESTATTSPATELHHTAEELQLAGQTRRLETVSPVEILDLLADDLLFPWSLLARVVGVSPTAVRKWRRGEATTATNHHALAEFLAFCRTLQSRDPRIDDVPRWLEMPVDRRIDMSRLDLYVGGVRAGLLDLASGRHSGEDLLDDSVPKWRDHAALARHFEVLVHDDGSTSIVPRAEAEQSAGW